MKRLECLDGLRGVLAVYVLLDHTVPFAMLPGWLIRLLTHGGAAVDVFFILSGMVIVQSLESFGWHARGFLIARAARTYPVYLAMLVLAVAVLPLPFDFARLPWIGPDSVARDVWPVGWPSAWLVEIATHLTMTHGLLPDAVVPGGWLGLLGAAWSLSAEWQFYILALWLGTRTGPRPLAAAFLVVATAGLLWQAAAAPGWAFSRAFLPNKAQFFALGIAERGTGARRYGAPLRIRPAGHVGGLCRGGTRGQAAAAAGVDTVPGGATSPRRGAAAPAGARAALATSALAGRAVVLHLPGE